MLRVASSLVFTLAFLAAAMAQAVAPPAEVVEEALRLPVTIGGQSFALEVMTVRRAGTDKLPVALITYGSAPGNPREVTAAWLRGWAHDLAHRGWLAVAVVRRGYGASDGEVAEDDGTCAGPDVGRYLDAHADDLEAALRSIAQRPDADMVRVLAIGNSVGGAAAMELDARKAVPLAAVVDVSGDLARVNQSIQPCAACAIYESDLVCKFARFGRTARMPPLWLHAENDRWFRPGLVGRLRSAFIGNGGQAQPVMLPPFQGDGHTMFSARAGRRVLLPQLDRFLRAHGLPTWDASPFDPLLARLPTADWAGVQEYLRQPTEKALALGPDGAVCWGVGYSGLDSARAQALVHCTQRVDADCTIIAENFHPLDPPAAANPAQQP